MANVRTDEFDFLEKVEREGFTQNYTEVYAVQKKQFNAFHRFIVAAVDSGDIVGEIHFQEGPIKEHGVNGVSNEDLILMVVNRIEDFQNSEYACSENDEAIEYLMKAIESLRSCTNRRISEGTEGTSIGN